MEKLYDYADLIKQFLNKTISASEFEKTYLEKFKKETAPMSDEIFLSLDWLFAEIDAYTGDPFDPKNNPYGWINEDQLRESAIKTLDELYKVGWHS
jgi:hypothetical protein